MRKNYLLLLLGAFVGLGLTACSKDPEEKIVPTEIEGVTGIEASYSRGLHEYLEITPDVSLSSETGSDVTYEWNIGYKTVSTEKILSFKCDELGEFDGFFKASSPTGAKIIDFKLRVSSPYDRGLLLLSETTEGALLSFKRLDIMETPVSPYAFKDNNPTLSLGKNALALCWKGEGVTQPTAASVDNGDFDVVISSSNPTKVYTLNTNDMKVKTEIAYDGNGTFHPNKIHCPLGVQEALWQGELYFTGDGREYIMSSEKTFVQPGEYEKLPEGTRIADYTCSLITEYDDRVRVYFDSEKKKLLYVPIVLGSAVLESETTCNGDIIGMFACDGIYYNGRYDPGHVMAIIANGNQVTVYRFSAPADLMMIEEEKLGEIDASGHILPTSALGVNPIKPILYYSKGNSIYRLNYDGQNFDSKPYITIEGNYEIKQIVFNRYDVNTLYLAAENLDETGELKASLFIYDISDNSSARLLFEDHRIGGSVKQLLYKGNGKEYESVVTEESILRKLMR